jgi:hypothetical protein
MDQHDNRNRPGVHSVGPAALLATRSLLFGAAFLAVIGACAPSFAAEMKNEHEIRRLSKFEARQIRHSCQDKAIEKGLHGTDRSAFLTKCYFGRARSFRRECTQLGVAKGLDKTALPDFVHSCIKERRHPKGDAPQ